MLYIKRREEFLTENTSYTKDNLHIVYQICVAMSLINPDFLSKILDKGIISRYTENDSVFLADLKNIILGKGRFVLGKKDASSLFVQDQDIAKANKIFNESAINFKIKDDWNILVSSRDTARNISDKILNTDDNDKLTPEQIKWIYWVYPNKEEQGISEDIVIETHSGKQYPIILGNFTLNKTISFNKLADDILSSSNKDKLLSEIYLDKWDKLSQEWLRLMYEYSKNDFRLYIEQFINPDRIFSVTYKTLFEITPIDKSKEILGIEVPELDKNYVYLADLLSDMFNSKNVALTNYEKLKKEWYDIKNVLLNSKILQHLFTESFNLLDTNETKETLVDDDKYTKASDKLKITILRSFLDIIKADELSKLYFNKTDCYMIPPKQYFRDNLDKIDVYYDMHNSVSDDIDITTKNEFGFKVKLYINSDFLADMFIAVGFGSKEMNGKLSAKSNLVLPKNFNFLLR